MLELVPVTACPLCEGECRELVSREQLSLEVKYRNRILTEELPRGTPAYMLDDLTAFTNSYEARLVVCSRCGLVCRDPHFSLQGSIAAYSRDQYAQAWLEKTFHEYYDAFAGRMPELKRRVGDGATVLELGSYVGGFLAAARDAGWHAQGVDVGEAVSRFARAKGLDVKTTTLREAHIADQSVDAVFVWVCFDQLPDPRQELDEIYRILKARGQLFIQVPNGAFVKVTERARRLLPWDSWRENVYRALAFTGIAGFPYQFGYTAHCIRQALTETGFADIRIHNRLDLCSRSGPGTASISKSRSLERVEKITNAVHSLTRGSAQIAPWMEVVCRKR